VSKVKSLASKWLELPDLQHSCIHQIKDEHLHQKTKTCFFEHFIPYAGRGGLIAPHVGMNIFCEFAEKCSTNR